MKVEAVPVGVGLFRVTGLTVTLGAHADHDSAEVVFPRWGRVVTSKAEAAAARDVIERARTAWSDHTLAS